VRRLVWLASGYVDGEWRDADIYTPESGTHHFSAEWVTDGSPEWLLFREALTLPDEDES
jgi:hypothetical protein